MHALPKELADDFADCGDTPMHSAFKLPPVLPLVSKAEGGMKRHFQKL